jgi:hypothetical protein
MIEAVPGMLAGIPIGNVLARVGGGLHRPRQRAQNEPFEYGLMGEPGWQSREIAAQKPRAEVVKRMEWEWPDGNRKSLQGCGSRQRGAR